MGYDKGSPAYLVYIPETGKILKYSFLEKEWNSKTLTDGPSIDDFMPLQRIAKPDICSVSDIDK